MSALKRKDLVSLRHAITEDRDEALRHAASVAEDARSDPDAAAGLELSMAHFDAAEQRLSRLPEVVHEPDMYRAGGPHSYFIDLAAVTDRSGSVAARGHMPQDALERLRRHDNFEAQRARVADGRASRQLAGFGMRMEGPSERAMSATVAGDAAEFVPPQYLTKLWADVSRAGCALKGLVTQIDLPSTGLNVVVPRITAAGVPTQRPQENTGSPELVRATDQISVEVATFSDNLTISQQLFDRAPSATDQAMVQAFADAYAETLAGAMMTGTGQNGQLLGLLNVSGSVLVTYTDASPTPAKVIQAVAQCAAQISDARRRSPTAVLSRGARWFWLAGSPDGSGNEPGERPGTGLIASDDTGPYGPIASLPLYHDNTIPTNLPATGSEAIVVVRARDLILLEEPTGPHYMAMPATDEAGQLTVVLQWHAYTAWIPHRYPSGIGSVQGTGLSPVAGF